MRVLPRLLWLGNHGLQNRTSQISVEPNEAYLRARLSVRNLLRFDKVRTDRVGCSSLGPHAAIELSRLNGKLLVRRMPTARMDDLLPTVSADVLFDCGH